jgi:hypothetical protein
MWNSNRKREIESAKSISIEFSFKYHDTISCSTIAQQTWIINIVDRGYPRWRLTGWVNLKNEETRKNIRIQKHDTMKFFVPSFNGVEDHLDREHHILGKRYKIKSNEETTNRKIKMCDKRKWSDCV